MTLDLSLLSSLKRRHFAVVILLLFWIPGLTLAQSRPDKKFLSVSIDLMDAEPVFGLLVELNDSAIVLLDYEDLKTIHTYCYDQIDRIIYFKEGGIRPGFWIGVGVGVLPAMAVSYGLAWGYGAAVSILGGVAVVATVGAIGSLIGLASRVNIRQEVNGDLTLFQQRSSRLARFQMDRSLSIRKTKRGMKNMEKLKDLASRAREENEEGPGRVN